MDTIRLKGLKVEAVVGVHAWERRGPRPLVIDLELATDVARAAQHDRLGDALDYSAVAQAVARFVATTQFQLIETLAERLAEQLRREFDVAWLRLELHKPGAVPDASGVSVAIERGRMGSDT